MDTLLIILIISAAMLCFMAMYDINKTRIRYKLSTLWLLLVILFPVFGPIIYFQLKRRLITPLRK
ncbi:PLDc N-terminal domain-containing protein [Plebeiibacterium sediminum]|uniref:PLDc N-terminal domain-containing protein n=1 Tax=Plebeiibacterium sediminum TaxID=2992112 RepID=A0AAE3M555_9BACT|nr:PLDc N-terminal domain-containing protein [Plebeiobacterium sediminum]MCW3787451.1 PLDc N-terminal domain-containing protein [Plebeiobacterium sediminum]